MAQHMQLLRSEKASRELGSAERALNLRERGALFLADGLKTRDELQILLQDDGGILQKLISDGYLLIVPVIDAGTLHPNKGVAGSAAQLPREFKPPASSSDDFKGKRSLATTRMFLFDICERMFARQSPELAQQFRDQLREARDRESMLAVARDIITKVEEVAGLERADGLSERIGMILPPE